MIRGIRKMEYFGYAGNVLQIDLLSGKTQLSPLDPDNGAESARQLYQKAFDILPSGGGMIVIDYMLNAERSGPAVPAFIDLGQYFSSDEGRTHTAVEVSDYLADAGFRVEGSREFIPGSLDMVWAKKP